MRKAQRAIITTALVVLGLFIALYAYFGGFGGGAAIPLSFASTVDTNTTSSMTDINTTSTSTDTMTSTTSTVDTNATSTVIDTNTTTTTTTTI